MFTNKDHLGKEEGGEKDTDLSAKENVCLPGAKKKKRLICALQL